MQKIVINECFGGFDLSLEALDVYARRTGRKERPAVYSLERDDPVLVSVVEDLGHDKASGRFGSIKIVEIPDDVKWHIHEYDGYETVHEDHRSWNADTVSSGC